MSHKLMSMTWSMAQASTPNCCREMREELKITHRKVLERWREMYHAEYGESNIPQYREVFTHGTILLRMLFGTTSTYSDIEDHLNRINILPGWIRVWFFKCMNSIIEDPDWVHFYQHNHNLMMLEYSKIHNWEVIQPLLDQLLITCNIELDADEYQLLKMELLHYKPEIDVNVNIGLAQLLRNRLVPNPHYFLAFEHTHGGFVL